MKRGNRWVSWAWLAIIAYMMFSVGRLAYRNYKLSVEEATLKQNIQKLENDIQDLKNKVIYYQSDSYKEKMLRAKLNLQKPGETVVVIPPEPSVKEPQEEETVPKTNPEKWWAYLFGDQS